MAPSTSLSERPLWVASQPRPGTQSRLTTAALDHFLHIRIGSPDLPDGADQSLELFFSGVILEVSQEDALMDEVASASR